MEFKYPSLSNKSIISSNINPIGPFFWINLWIFNLRKILWVIFTKLQWLPPKIDI